MAVVLECTEKICVYGSDGGRWRSPLSSETVAKKMLDCHILSHGKQITSVRTNDGFGVKRKLEELHMPFLSSRSTKKDFKFFVDQWEYREYILAKRVEKDLKCRSQGINDLRKLKVGFPVTIMNKIGNEEVKWDKRGIVLENEPHSQVQCCIYSPFADLGWRRN